MSVSLKFQSIYCQRDSVAKPATITTICIILLLLVLISKIWLKVNITDYGYELAKTQRQTMTLVKQLQELELQQAILMREDNLTDAAKLIGLSPISPEQLELVGQADSGSRNEIHSETYRKSGEVMVISSNRALSPQARAQGSNRSAH